MPSSFFLLTGVRKRDVRYIPFPERAEADEVIDYLIIFA